MRVVHSGLPPCVGPWVVDDAGVWRRWCVVPEGEAPVLAAETDNPDEREACDAAIVAHVLVGDHRGVKVDAGHYARVGNLR